MRQGIRGVVWGVVLLGCLGCTSESGEGSDPFVTEYGLGPDKWATAWFLTRFVDSGAELVVVELGDELPPGRTFDVPGSAIYRRGNQAALEAALSVHHVNNPVIADFAHIIHDIEVNFWGGDKFEDTPIVEQAFRNLQIEFGRGSVEPECYLTFFDTVYQALEEKHRDGSDLSTDKLMIECDASQEAKKKARELVPEIKVSHVLSEIKKGKTVLFVDVREPEEFREAHIPGAVNITLREVNQGLLQAFSGADYVISYCVKDFRGFEMAKALQNIGVKNSVFLNPYGIQGWISEGLPTVGEKSLDESNGREQMDRCVADIESCRAVMNR